MENRKRIKIYGLGFCFLLFILMGCKAKQEDSVLEPLSKTPLEESIELKDVVDYDESLWMEITTENSGIAVDIKYATIDNFTNEVIYDCPRCFLRPEIGKALIQLNRGINKRYGMQLKVWDCYRPLPAQQKLWDIVPNASYVTPPAKGSMHNRGMAVDITLIDKDGNDINMGTAYDHFGIEAHIDNLDLAPKVIGNRKMLQAMMKEIGFKTIRTEWWHFSYLGELRELADWEWACK